LQAHCNRIATTIVQPSRNLPQKEKELKEMLSSIGPKTIKSAEPYFEALAKYSFRPTLLAHS
jgi:hypothetical protein